MKLRKLFAALAVAAFVTISAFAADPAVGKWQSIDENTMEVTAYWEMWVENGKLFGKIITVPNQDDSTLATECAGKKFKNFPYSGDPGALPVAGTTWITDVENKGEGLWKNGFIVDPGAGKQYTCEITFHKTDGKKFKEDTLEMRGKIGPFGRSQFWKRAE